MKKSKIFLAGLISFVISGVSAQSGYEFSFYGGSGLSALRYDIAVGKMSPAFGGHLGMGYHLFLSPSWSVETGMGLALYNNVFRLNNFKTNYMTTDPDDVLFEFRVNMSDYEEKRRAVMFQIPLMLQYHFGKKNAYYVAFGGKIGLPLKATYECSGVVFNNSGYYEEEDYEYDSQQFLGLGEYYGKASSGNLNFKTTVFASAETGCKWKLNKHLWLYTGVYLDYGITNSQYTQPDVFESITDKKITAVAAGVKLRLTINTQKPPPKKAPPRTTSTRPASSTTRPATTPASTTAVLPEKEQEPSGTPAKEEAPQEEIASQKALLWSVKEYQLSESDITDKQKQELDIIISMLQQDVDSKFYIYGHSCDLGTSAFNDRLCLQRAEKVKAYMLSKGIDESRILGVASKRDAEPLVPNTSEENRKINRRVEIRL